MTVVEALQSLGGCARAKALRGLVSRRRIDAAVRDGSVVHNGRVYAVAPSDRAQVMATELRGVRSHRTAAAHHGLALPPGDDRIDITVPDKARRPDANETLVKLRYRNYHEADHDGDVTTPLRTVLDCLRDEPLDVALSVGDSALNQELVTAAEIERAVRQMRGPRSRVARNRAALLDAEAANAFESSMRAILLDAGITGFEPQVVVRRRGEFVGRVDLAHWALRIVIECDGFETHGTRRAYASDLLRHTELVAAGWRPLRFTWEQVMFNREWVLGCVQDVIDDVRRAQNTGQRRREATKAA